ncbi:uncharacterized protein V1510DRAFT_109594 [Dipodascopsis tothii]|uniref:uncharacterized protein n=1 Tax=Dipodascopsis tothii TaxID=44089 RepID=UPI0034CD41C0
MLRRTSARRAATLDGVAAGGSHISRTPCGARSPDPLPAGQLPSTESPPEARTRWQPAGSDRAVVRRTVCDEPEDRYARRHIAAGGDPCGYMQARRTACGACVRAARAPPGARPPRRLLPPGRRLPCRHRGQACGVRRVVVAGSAAEMARLTKTSSFHPRRSSSPAFDTDNRRSQHNAHSVSRADGPADVRGVDRRRRGQ